MGLDKGYVQVYTGNGKGKTTCMLGLSLRAVGAGLRVYIGQFIKDGNYSEIKAIRQHLPMVTIEQYGKANDGIGKAKTALSGEYDIVILDEVNVAVHKGIISADDISQLIALKPDKVELVLTGRYASQAVIEKADLITGMTEVKHYYKQGVSARVGIEK